MLKGQETKKDKGVGGRREHEECHEGSLLAEVYKVKAISLTSVYLSS